MVGQNPTGISHLCTGGIMKDPWMEKHFQQWLWTTSPNSHEVIRLQTVNTDLGGGDYVMATHRNKTWLLHKTQVFLSLTLTLINEVCHCKREKNNSVAIHSFSQSLFWRNKRPKCVNYLNFIFDLTWFNYIFLLIKQPKSFIFCWWCMSFCKLRFSLLCFFFNCVFYLIMGNSTFW